MMRIGDKRGKLKALPVQIVEIPGGVVLKRGCTEVTLAGSGTAEAVRMVLNATGTGASVRAIRQLFALSSGRDVKELVKNLVERNLLVPSESADSTVNEQESNVDIFFWHFGETARHAIERLNQVRLQIIGVNFISRQLAVSLAACGHRNVEVIDHPQHRNLRLFDGAGELKKEEWPTTLNRPRSWNGGKVDVRDCLVATSDFGGQQALRRWNKLCIDRRVHFMPVLLKNMIGYVGPLVIPGETACYECFTARQTSHAIETETEHITDKVAFDGQGVVGFHPTMASILGDIAAFELTRFYAEVMPGRKVGRLLEVNLLAGGITERTVLKVPRCAACSPLQTHARTNLTKSVFEETGAHLKQSPADC